MSFGCEKLYILGTKFIRCHGKKIADFLLRSNGGALDLPSLPY